MERIVDVQVCDDMLHVVTDAGNTYSKSLLFYPILRDATDHQRARFEIGPMGDDIHWPLIDEDIHISSVMREEAPIVENVISSVFKRFSFLNVSAVARRLGIHKSLLAQYIYGTSTPSKEREVEILNALREMGSELVSL